MREGVIGFDRIVRWHSAKDEGLREEDLRGERDVEFEARSGKSLRAYKCDNCGSVEFFSPT
jgi:hypothetical protein